jgi:hypothetical protein
MTLLFVFVLCAVSAFAQSSTTAVLSGVVTDPTQAVAPDAKVTITRVDTGQSREAKTGSEGEYRLVQLPSGLYDVKVEKPGFLTQTKKGIELTVGQNATLDFQLAVGASSPIVEISSEPPLIESERSQQADANSFRVKQTPDSGLSFYKFPSVSAGELRETMITHLVANKSRFGSNMLGSLGI